jgi:uracil-DNA glycosylase
MGDDEAWTAPYARSAPRTDAAGAFDDFETANLVQIDQLRVQRHRSPEISAAEGARCNPSIGGASGLVRPQIAILTGNVASQPTVPTNGRS